MLDTSNKCFIHLEELVELYLSNNMKCKTARKGKCSSAFRLKHASPVSQNSYAADCCNCKIPFKQTILCRTCKVCALCKILFPSRFTESFHR